ncbi:hypothetical protein [Streptomyces sp. NPDC005374]|uniref:hypothetical protein n=1 Tax=Streptomyces sp. NPDC005374 TaxID=3364713 RepID=UPI0036897868
MSATREYGAERSARFEDLPVNPFVALRVAYGMTLGEDDFGTLLGNPRGKQMLHASWLHGSGVVWGFPVLTGDNQRALHVGPGLAVDGLGRELSLRATDCLVVKDLLNAQKAGEQGVPGAAPGTYRLVAVFDTCQALPVPAVASPCDPSPKHFDHSRTVERVRFELRPPVPEPEALRYPRLRQLFAPDRSEHDTDPADRLRTFRELATQDVTELAPATEEDDRPALFPVDVADAPVTLATVEIRGSGQEATVGVVDQTVRRVLLPTGLLQELVGSLRPPADAGIAPKAPRVVGESLQWTDDYRRFTFSVTETLYAGSVGAGAVTVSSVGARAWARAEVREVAYRTGADTVTVVLDAPPRHDVVRIIVHGTGPTPLLGSGLVPLAGLDDGPPGTAADGHDAVIMGKLGRARS